MKTFGTPCSLIILHAIVCKCYGLLYNLTDNIDDVSNENYFTAKVACFFLPYTITDNSSWFLSLYHAR